MLIPIIGWIVFGLIVGAIARLIYPGRQDLGLIKTTLLGVVGSFVGGFIAYLLFGGSAMQASGWIGSIVGAVAVLAIALRVNHTPPQTHTH
ncbi:GlsB/YeaQ/YmgE family stress response membrane protein [Rhodopirellula bahusiensis]|uniref:GlsB/YeaQ/YmgE family stress response membrane protein n=1 Tax=Rhodopirellula bahusiensis TaxID=2014065 RepID=A0A2G1W1L7_9BACT|nr:GlsB/YeaQ/YmgE family stress response membrane protein [Rhodopirellula bahusiensis]PHQ32923.1 GlsB/YeaQ/YmgE family stress response membrane protein [Rhodopirellula bahusiensis]